MIPSTLDGWKVMTGCNVDTYRVGLLSDLHQIRQYIRTRSTNAIAYRVGRSAGYVAAMLKSREWHHLRQYLNGWLAEMESPMSGRSWTTRCGRGWTRASAERSLLRHLIERAQEVQS